MRLRSFLRSRRLAVVLLVGVTVYAWVVTLVPLASLDPAAAAAWDLRHPLLAVVVNALGLHRAYSSPAFIAAVVLLTVSTAACAWERTQAASRAWRMRRDVSSSALERLRTSPAFVVDLRSGAEREDSLVMAARSLRGLGMRARRNPESVTGSSGAAGLLGSPLFHWALVGLFVFAGSGQLTRYEGYVNMIAGDTVEDAPEAYSLDLARAPLAGPATFTGVGMTLVEIDFDHPVGGDARGRAAVLRLARGGQTLREQWVYPNKPLRYGPLLIQRAASGPALVGSVNTAGREQQRVRLYYEDTSKSPRRFRVIDPSTAATLTVEVTPVGGKRVGVAVVGSAEGKQTIGVAEAVTLARGVEFVVDDLTYYAQLQVVNDWSVPWVYAMFGLGIIGMVLTTFVPPRTIRVLAVDGPAGLHLHVAITHPKNDPAFPRRAERVLREDLAGHTAPDGTQAQEREGKA